MTLRKKSQIWWSSLTVHQKQSQTEMLFPLKRWHQLTKTQIESLYKLETY